MSRIGWELPLAAVLCTLALLGFVLKLEPLAVAAMIAIAFATPFVLLAAGVRMLTAVATQLIGWRRRNIGRRSGAGARG